MSENRNFEYALDGHVNGVDKDIFDYLDSPAFKVHGIEMNCRDIIQAVLFMNYVLSDTIKDSSSIYNLFSFEINMKKNEVQCIGLHHAKLSSSARSKNTMRYDIKNDTKTFYLCCGFMKDYFTSKEPKKDIDFNKYVFDEGQTFKVTAKNLEELIQVQKRK